LQIRLDGYREELARGKGLSEEQQRATDRYDEVVANLELTKEFLTAFEKIGSETSKEEKKRKKKEIFERQQYELSRFKELFTIQVCILFLTIFPCWICFTTCYLFLRKSSIAYVPPLLVKIS
jgi:hypothetical protein